MLMLRQIEVIRAILVPGTVGWAARLGLRDKGVTSLLVEQNAKQALQMSDYGLVLEQGQTWIMDTAPRILTDIWIAQLFLSGGLAQAESVA